VAALFVVPSLAVMAFLHDELIAIERKAIVIRFNFFIMAVD
jgi:hypothetical protein